MISLPKHVKNLKQKACKYVEKNPADCCSIVSDLYQKSKKTRCIGEECLKYGITEDLLDALTGSEVENESMCSFNLVKAPTFIITNKLLLELNDYREKKGRTWSTLLSWLLSFAKEKNKETSVFAFHWLVDKIVEQKRELMRHKGKIACDNFLSEKFKFPEKQSHDSEILHLFTKHL